MTNQQVQNKPTAAYILSLIGGILGIFVSLAFVGLGALALIAEAEDPYYYYYGYSGLFGWSGAMLAGIGIWALITSILIIVFAGKLKANPMEHSKWGILILIFSIIGVGGLLAFIGGILALVYKPIPAGAYGAPQPYAQQPQQYYQPPQQPASPQQITRICPSCGRVVNESIKFCPHCGKQLG